MNFTFNSDLIQSGVWYPRPPETRLFRQVAIDSRKVFATGGVLFFCIRGERHDGHQFQDEAIEKGVRHLVVDHLPVPLRQDTFYLLVPDTLLSLQQLAAHHRSGMNARFFGITGSNGKTIVKEWLYTLLNHHYRVARSPRSFNSQVGVPLSLLLVEPGHDLALIEAGISRPGEMERLAAMIQPEVGIFTYLGSAHDEGFTDKRQKLAEKLKLFRGCSMLIVPATLTEAYPEEFAMLSARRLTWGYSEGADLVVLDARLSGEWRKVRFRFANKEYEYQLAHTDEASLHNSLSALLGAHVAGLAMDHILEGLAHLPTLTMRLEARAGRNGNLLINDHYNADPDSLRIALDLYTQRKGNLGGWIILSDMDETGLAPDERAHMVAAMLDPVPCDRISLIGNHAAEVASLLTRKAKVECFQNAAEFLERSDWEQVRDSAILIKGGRRFALEHISRRFVRYAHRTRLEINLSALSHNLRAFAGTLQKGVRLMVMVKASAYGSGSTEIARWLSSQRVDYLGVAYADEGVELRQAGVNLPILVMNADESAFPSLVSARLEPQIHSLQQLRELLHFLAPDDPLLHIHIKLETGMNRLGFSKEQFPDLLRLLNSSGQVKVASILSHLAAAEDATLDERSHVQAARFEDMARALSDGLGYRPIRHLLNSSGILRLPAYQYEMVRLGIGLYGVTAHPEQPTLRPALALRTLVSRVHTVPAGESVGYGQKGMAAHSRRIATLAAGYADGLLRLAGEGRFSVRIHGKSAPTVGAICMDMCMVDVSDIPEIKEGDEAMLFDEHYPIHHLAAALQTIPYEVLTNISARAPRIYFEE